MVGVWFSDSFKCTVVPVWHNAPGKEMVMKNV